MFALVCPLDQEKFEPVLALRVTESPGQAVVLPLMEAVGVKVPTVTDAEVSAQLAPATATT